MKKLTCILWIALSSLGAAEEFRILPTEFNSDKKNQMMRAYQRQQVHAALDTRLAELETALESPASIAAYQAKRQDFIKQTFQPLLANSSPLNAQVTKVIRRDGYTVENLLFESLPGLYVTANLYRPIGDGPFPAVLLPCGHSDDGKAYSSYQLASILLAQHGFIVLCFDPLGQGERRQLVGDRPHTIENPPSEHNKIAAAPILLGTSLAAMMVWDGVRGIDYLCSRDDVDAQRIGCTGNSGGGNLTSFLMAFDERIVAAAPGCFMTTHRRKNESPGPGDAEQNLFAQIRDGFDHPDFILTRAPRPTLILAATQDYVPIDGAWEAFRQAKRVYTQLGSPERIDLIEANEKHGFSRPLREGCVRFMARWLQGRELEVSETGEPPVLADADLQVTPDGQVRWLPGARSVFDVFEELEKSLAQNRPRLTTDLVRQVTGIQPLAELARPEIEEVTELVSQADDQTGPPIKLILHPEPGIALPALHWPDGELVPVLIAPGEGMNSAVAEARRLNALGHPALIVEVRDSGETQTRNWRFFGADWFIGYMLGQNWLAMRAEDLLVSSRWLAETSGQTAITLMATGEAVPAALHARYLESELIGRLTTSAGLGSWRSLMTESDAFSQIHQVVHGALRFYDLPDLIKD